MTTEMCCYMTLEIEDFLENQFGGIFRVNVICTPYDHPFNENDCIDIEISNILKKDVTYFHYPYNTIMNYVMDINSYKMWYADIIRDQKINEILK